MEAGSNGPGEKGSSPLWTDPESQRLAHGVNDPSQVTLPTSSPGPREATEAENPRSHTHNPANDRKTRVEHEPLTVH